MEINVALTNVQQLTTFIPHTTVVLPTLAIAEPSAVSKEPTFNIMGLNLSNSLPSGRILCER